METRNLATITALLMIVCFVCVVYGYTETYYMTQIYNDAYLYITFPLYAKSGDTVQIQIEISPLQTLHIDSFNIECSGVTDYQATLISNEEISSRRLFTLTLETEPDVAGFIHCVIDLTYTPSSCIFCTFNSFYASLVPLKNLEPYITTSMQNIVRLFQNLKAVNQREETLSHNLWHV